MKTKLIYKTQTCRNCGLNGHLYKNCPHPIISFGIICYKIENNEITILKTMFNKYDHLIDRFSELTAKEKQAIKLCDHEVIRETDYFFEELISCFMTSV